MFGWDFYDNDATRPTRTATEPPRAPWGRGNNGIGVAGVNWHCSLMIFRVGGSPSHQAILDSLQRPASTARSRTTATAGGFSSTFSNLIESAGQNYSTSSVRPPRTTARAAAAGGLLPVQRHLGGRDRLTTPRLVQPVQHNVDLGAPGVNTLSTTPNNGYSSYSGTSMACPTSPGPSRRALQRARRRPVRGRRGHHPRHRPSVPGLSGLVVTGGVRTSLPPWSSRSSVPSSASSPTSPTTCPRVNRSR